MHSACKTSSGNAPSLDSPSPKVILKLDDFRLHFPETGVHPHWIELLSKIRAKNGKMTAGIVSTYINGNKANGDHADGAVHALDQGGKKWIDWVKAQHASGDIEFWQHGWDHRPSFDEDASGKTSEFEASPERQRKHFNRAQKAALDGLGFAFKTFGAPGNKVNADTMSILDAHTEITARFYGDDHQLTSNAFNIRRIGGGVETNANWIFAPSFEVYERALKDNIDRYYLALQMHPELWQKREDLDTFQRIIDDLDARGYSFITAQDLIQEMQQRRAQAGPMIDFDAWGSLDLLFVASGQGNNYYEKSDIGVAQSRGIAVTDGEAQSALTLQRPFSGKLPQFEMSICFQHKAPTFFGGQPLYLGVTSEGHYSPSLSSSENPENHLLISLDLNEAPNASQPRLRIIAISNGKEISNTTGPKVTEKLIPQAWYRLHAKIILAPNGYQVNASLSLADENSLSAATLTQYSISGIRIPQIEQNEAIYPLFGGQGKAVSRGINALDNFYVSAYK